jgi:hypothetical protein
MSHPQLLIRCQVYGQRTTGTPESGRLGRERLEGKRSPGGLVNQSKCTTRISSIFSAARMASAASSNTNHQGHLP